MWDLKACTVCFSTAKKLYSLNVGVLRKDFNLISGLQIVQGNGMPEYLCVECSAYVMKFKKFRDRCHRAHYALEQLLIRNKEIKKSNLNAFDRQLVKIMPTLNYIDLDKIHYEQIQFKLDNYQRTSVSPPGFVPVAHYSTLTRDDTFESELTVTSSKEREGQIKIEVDPVVHLNVAISNETHTANILQDTNSHDNVGSTFMNTRSKVKNVLPSSVFTSHLDCNDLNGDMNHDTFDDSVSNAYENDSENIKLENVSCTGNNTADGCSLEEEYGELVPLSVTEAKAAVEVYQFTSIGKYRCNNCGKRCSSKEKIKLHSRRHDKHISGIYRCEICDYYFRTMFLLQCHMRDHHMYKYLCKKCPEVSFSKPAAKKHYVFSHIQMGQKQKDGAKWEIIPKPAWLGPGGGARVKGSITPSKPKKLKRTPKDYPVYTPISQEEQYAMVAQRKGSRNYLEARFKCELCYRGYRHTTTYNKHMAKHDPAISGIHQCDMCKLYFRDTRRVYKHMHTYHLFKYSCRFCEFVCTNKGQSLYHYRFHKNVTYDCPHCDKKFTKISTQLTHIRFKHPGTDICNLCGHSFVSSSGLNCHMQMSHSKEEQEISEAMSGKREAGEPYYCKDCSMQFLDEKAYMTHLGSSRNHVQTNVSVMRQERTNRREERKGNIRGPRTGRSTVLNTGTITATACEVCGTYLANDVTARRHYEAEHPGTDYLKRYMCDVCGHTTKQYANLLVHMRVHTQEKPYACPHCERRFSMPSNRDRHLVVHTGEKRYQCQHCSRRFTQSTAVKLHIQTVHMKIPYKPWDKKNRKRRKDAEPTTQGLDVASVPEVATSLPAQHKILLEPQGAYVTYIAFEDEQ